MNSRFSLLRITPCLLIFLMAPALFAGKIKHNAIPNRGIFGIQVAGTDQEFYGRVDRVISVSFQEYTTGALIVSEVVIDMADSNQLLRIYSMRPPSMEDAQRHADSAAGAVSGITGATPPALPAVPDPVLQADQQIQKNFSNATAGMVVKTYPVTTHAKTVEFSVATKAELHSFYQSFRDLYSNREVKVDSTSGHTISANNSGGNTGNTTSTINRLGGALFIIE